MEPSFNSLSGPWWPPAATVTTQRRRLRPLKSCLRSSPSSSPSSSSPASSKTTSFTSSETASSTASSTFGESASSSSTSLEAASSSFTSLETASSTSAEAASSTPGEPASSPSSETATVTPRRRGQVRFSERVTHSDGFSLTFLPLKKEASINMGVRQRVGPVPDLNPVDCLSRRDIQDIRPLPAMNFPMMVRRCPQSRMQALQAARYRAYIFDELAAFAAFGVSYFDDEDQHIPSPHSYWGDYLPDIAVPRTPLENRHQSHLENYRESPLENNHHSQLQNNHHSRFENYRTHWVDYRPRAAQSFAESDENLHFTAPDSHLENHHQSHLENSRPGAARHPAESGEFEHPTVSQAHWVDYRPGVAQRFVESNEIEHRSASQFPLENFPSVSYYPTESGDNDRGTLHPPHTLPSPSENDLADFTQYPAESGDNDRDTLHSPLENDSHHPAEPSDNDRGTLHPPFEAAQSPTEDSFNVSQDLAETGTSVDTMAEEPSERFMMTRRRSHILHTRETANTGMLGASASSTAAPLEESFAQLHIEVAEHPLNEVAGLEANNGTQTASGAADDLETVDTVNSREVHMDYTHPWGIIDYHLYLLGADGDRDVEMRRRSTYLFDGEEDCRPFFYEELLDEAGFEMGIAGADPIIIFKLLPIFRDGTDYDGEQYVLGFDYRANVLIARWFEDLPERVEDFGTVWETGETVYALPLSSLQGFMVETFRFCESNFEQGILDAGTDTSPAKAGRVVLDEPILQLVIVIQWVTFVQDFAEVLLENPPHQMGAIQAELAHFVGEVRAIVEKTSLRSWFAVRYGLSFEQFIHGAHKDRFVHELFLFHNTSSLAGPNWHAPGFQTAEMIRQELRRRARSGGNAGGSGSGYFRALFVAPNSVPVGQAPAE